MTDPFALPCGATVDDLAALAEGILDAAQAAHLSAHVALCPKCHYVLTDPERVDLLLQAAYPVVDDPARRAAIVDQAVADHRARTRPPEPANGRHPA